MKTKWKIMVVLAGLAVVTASAGEPSSVENIFGAMRAGTYSEKYGRYTFPQLGTNDIPKLLVRAGNTNILKSFPVNGVSSIGRMMTNEGMIALVGEDEGTKERDRPVEWDGADLVWRKNAERREMRPNEWHHEEHEGLEELCSLTLHALHVLHGEKHLGTGELGRTSNSMAGAPS